MKILLNNKRQYMVTLPVGLVKAKQWKKGDKIKTEIDNKGNMVLKKVLG